MKILFTVIYFFLSLLLALGQGQGYLKSVIYDFDGFSINQTDLPDGDYKNNDLIYHVAANPLTASNVLGDRVLKMDLNWQTGTGEFGKNIARFIELDISKDRLNFYLYNPLSNSGDAVIHLTITEDDNQSNLYEGNLDDRWIHIVTVPRSAGWQLVSVPLSSFTDDSQAGNGIFDAGYTGNGGMLFSVGFIFHKPLPASASDHYFMDMACFTEGILPTGASIFDLPAGSSTERCLLGAYTHRGTADSIPADIEGLFPSQPQKKLRYINWFLEYSDTGTTPSNFTGAEVQHLLNAGYRPVITWEMLYSQYPRLDPVQPRLDKLLTGNFDSYIDAFADKIKSYNDTVILRIFHEFEGDWYPWSLTENNQDPAMYIAAFRYVVDRFRARGATKVQWMWCVNAEPKPYRVYNWIVPAYPGDNYVDIVAVDVYNHPDLNIPFWKSFRYTLAESYYYLTKYFPHKPFYICEVACRERYPSQDLTSQGKAEWLCEMDKELQSYFDKTRALIFFSIIKEHDWRINSSAAAQNAVGTCIWNDAYYFTNSVHVDEESNPMFNIYPNPFIKEISVAMEVSEVISGYEIRIFNVTGQQVLSATGNGPLERITTGNELVPGLYLVELKNNSFSKMFKMVKIGEKQ